VVQKGRKKQWEPWRRAGPTPRGPDAHTDADAGEAAVALARAAAVAFAEEEEKRGATAPWQPPQVLGLLVWMRHAHHFSADLNQLLTGAQLQQP
jgi:hypothetical protein